jgi:hypothetical protein
LLSEATDLLFIVTRSLLLGCFKLFL